MRELQVDAQAVIVLEAHAAAKSSVLALLALE